MSDETIKQFVDFTAGSDTGFDQASAILPVADGENATAAVLNRPGELLRLRTEAIKSILEDVLYLRDMDRSLMLGGPGLVTWDGSTTEGADGIVEISNTLWLVPALTPGSAQTAPVPPVTSKYGTLTLDRAGDLAGITITSRRRSYLGGDRINVEVVLTGGVLSASVLADGRSIRVLAPTSSTLTAVINAINALTADSPATQLVTATLAAGATGTDLLVSPQAKEFIAGNYDGEGHTITQGNLASFFGTPANRLAEGDTLCIQYDKLIDSTGGLGGRRQSIPENTNTTVPVGAFFNSRLNPERLPNAIPLCKVINNRLVFLNGQTVPAGATTWDLGDTTANVPPDAVPSYAGGVAWADGDANPAATVEVALDKVISDLATDGGDKIGIGAQVYSSSITPLAASSLAARLLALDAAYDTRLDTLTSGLAGAISTAASDLATGLALKVAKAGDTMTGQLQITDTATTNKALFGSKGLANYVPWAINPIGPPQIQGRRWRDDCNWYDLTNTGSFWASVSNPGGGAGTGVFLVEGGIEIRSITPNPVTLTSKTFSSPSKLRGFNINISGTVANNALSIGFTGLRIFKPLDTSDFWTIQFTDSASATQSIITAITPALGYITLCTPTTTSILFRHGTTPDWKTTDTYYYSTTLPGTGTIGGTATAFAVLNDYDNNSLVNLTIRSVELFTLNN